jgi:hypothetical protein
VLFGAPDIDAKAVIAEMRRLAPQWLAGCALRECWFEPTFHKHVGQLCNGVHDPCRGRVLRPCTRSGRGGAGAGLQGDPPAVSGLSDLWRDFPYEYEFDKLAIDVINGGPAARMGGRRG